MTTHDMNASASGLPAEEPRDTAALLINDAGQYLLHLRDANKPIRCPGTWALPGGHAEPGESCDEAIARELLEETGLSVPGLRPFSVVERVDGSGTVTDRVLVYLGTWNGAAHEIDLREGIQLRWTDAAETAHMTMDPGTLAVIHEHRLRGPARNRDGVRPAVVRLREPRSATERNIIGGHLYLERDGTVLLGKRHPDSAYAPSTWHVPAGHCELEPVRRCVVREVAEETGIVVAEEDLTLVHTVHLLDPVSPVPRMQLFFRPSRWRGEPRLLEPDRCLEWRWWPLDALPEPLVHYTRAALGAIARGETYSQLGWPT
ncbi:hypothetical protein GCM10010377_17550 [Streptomyces viridiviolaceus]|uniref:NUDIX domain-containing protein n=1 Tax=Streptomyces viridiviolaceus TaxID=68282 RepID=A0ABW2DTJ3_9ACTN|nr:NUDIX domain-containing protein [Streptomyces viridiviolaceus]GHB27937.1 hypothetical protein GCM10010377_17550 [Streptomyces viridiviolaceus]